MCCVCRGAENGICAVGAAGLGASLVLIHIYVTPLKRLLQASFPQVLRLCRVLAVLPLCLHSCGQLSTFGPQKRPCLAECGQPGAWPPRYIKH